MQYTNGGSLRRIIDRLEKLGGPPGFKVVAGLEAALHAAFVDTQIKTHIITGSLKASGKTESDFNGDSEWTGIISYGGSSTGVNNPVDYAIYEMARGGDHDFFRDLQLYDRQFAESIDRHFEGL